MSDGNHGRHGNDNGADRLPPHSREAEQGVLGCCLLGGGSAVAEMMAKLKKAECFYELRHQTLYKHLAGMREYNRPIDMMTVAARLEVSDTAQEVGGMAYLMELTEATPAEGNLEYYAKMVHDLYMLRRVICVCAQASQKAWDPRSAENPGEVIDLIEREILEVNSERVESEDRDWRTIVRCWRRRREPTLARPTAWWPMRWIHTAIMRTRSMAAITVDSCKPT